MIAAWMLYVTAVAVVVSLAALAVERGLRLYRLPVRYVWVGATGVSLVVPLAALLRSDAPPPEALPAVRVDAWSVPMEVMAGVGHSTAGVDTLLVAAWVAASLITLAVLVGAARRLTRERAAWQPARVHGMPVLVSPGVGPAVVGLIRPAIVVPEWLLALPPVERRLAVLHEAEHVAAGDGRLLLVGAGAVVLMPWNAALWWLLARLRAAIEVDCDQRVLARGVSADAYAGLLVRVKERGQGLLAVTPALAEPKGLLTRRVTEMIPQSIRARPWRAAAYAAGAATLFVLACDAPKPQQPEAPVASSLSMKQPLDPAAYAGALDETAVDEVPERLWCPPAEYPRALSEAGVEGSATLQLVVDTAGRVIPSSVEVIRSDHSDFAAAARDMVARCRFQPGRLNGSPVNTQVRIPISFRPARTSARAPGANEGSAEWIRMTGGGPLDARLMVRCDENCAVTAPPDREPLYIVDGVVQPGKPDLDALAIYSIEVVKGAAAKAVWGPRAANGVIAITTK